MVQTLFISTTSTDIEPWGEMSAKMQKKEVRETVLSNWGKKLEELIKLLQNRISGVQLSTQKLNKNT